MKLHHDGRRERIPLILADTVQHAADIAESIGIHAHVRGIRQSGRGCSASSVFIDAAIWPLSDENLQAVLPVIAPGGALYVVERKL